MLVIFIAYTIHGIVKISTAAKVKKSNTITSCMERFVTALKYLMT